MMGILNSIGQTGQAAVPGLQQLLLMTGANKSNLADRIDSANAIADRQKKLALLKEEEDRQRRLRDTVKNANSRREIVNAYLKYNPEAALKYGQSLNQFDNNDLYRKKMQSEIEKNRLLGFAAMMKGAGDNTTSKEYKPTKLDLTLAQNIVASELSRRGLKHFTDLGEEDPAFTEVRDAIASTLVQVPRSQWGKQLPTLLQRLQLFNPNSGVQQKPSGEQEKKKSTTSLIGTALKNMTKEGGLSTAPDVDDGLDVPITQKGLGSNLMGLFRSLNLHQLPFGLK